MIKVRFIILLAIALAAILFAQTARATVLTFEVEDGDAYVGSLVNLPDTYGFRVDEADNLDGNYLEGNGWTPNVTVTYLPKGGFNGGAVYPTAKSTIDINNGGFESYSDGDPTWQSPVDVWSFGSNEGGHAASRGEDSGDHASYPDGGATEGNL